MRARVDTRVFERRDRAVAGTRSILGKARAMEQREVIGREVALIDLQLPDDGPQVRVARFESRDGRGKISRRRRM